MNIKKFKWTKALALLIAFTMVMMYNFSFVLSVYADQSDVKVHFPSNSELFTISDGIAVEITLEGGTLLKGSSKDKSGWEYNVSITSGILPAENTSVSSIIITLFKNDLPIASFDQLEKESQIGKNGVYNIWFNTNARLLWGSMSIHKTVDGKAIADENLAFEFTVAGANDFSKKVTAGAIDGVLSELPPGSYTIIETNQVGYLPTSAGAIKISATNPIGTVHFNNITECDTDQYDLSISKNVDAISKQIGTEVTFSIIIMNSADSEITVGGIFADEIWPEGLSISSIVAEEGTIYSQIDDRWAVGTLMPGQSKALTISAIATTLGSITNTINIGTDRPFGDTNTENDSDSVTIRVYDQTEPIYDLGITKLANVSSVTVGGGFTFTVTISNNGDSTFSGIRVQDVWPEALTQGTPVPQAGTTFTALTGIWEVGILGPDESKTISFPATSTVTGTVTNVVEIIGEGEEVAFEDQNTENNTASAAVSVVSGSTGTTTRTTSTSTPVVVVEPEIPLAEDPVILEDPTPLADAVPQTSDAGNIWLLLGLMMASGAGMTALGRKKETK